MSRYIESQLILPALYLMSLRTDGNITTSELITELRDLLKPNEEDLDSLSGRKDDRFSQIVRNLVSHKTLVRMGLADFANSTFTITSEGINYLEEENNKEEVDEKYRQQFEGEETLNNDNPTTIEEYPDTSINIARDNFSVHDLKRKKDKGRLLLDPDFQRKDVWNSFQKSELIESVLMNIPLPYIYLTQNKDGFLIVVDGRQRLTSLFDFIDDSSFKLSKKLKILRNIRGKRFGDLDSLSQAKIEDYQLMTYIIKPPTSDRVMIDIFDRVNRGGTILNNQEIRNALYQGPATTLLKKLCESAEFKVATTNSIKSTRMRDRYIILRFLAFYLWRTVFNNTKSADNSDFDYKGNIEDFLPKYMKYINTLEEKEINSLESAFKTAMINTHSILGDDGFRLPNKRNPDKKRAISMALFEALGYLMANKQVVLHKENIKTKVADLLNREEFIKSFLSIDSSVKYRFDEMDKILKSIS